jgi:peptidoglycan/xylan/chitin deacetylase (PgdA/CDA1 family)
MSFVETYQSIKQKSVRNTIRSGALNVLSLLDRFSPSALKVKRVQFIYLHHVFADEVNQLHELLNFLSQDHKFISYSEAVKKIHSNDIDDAYICFSTDDGFKNNLKAAEIFNSFGIKACFFVCADMIGEDNDLKIDKICRAKFHLPAIEFLAWRDLELLLKNGHEIGSHTLSHVNLAASEVSKAQEEILNSKAVIESRLGNIDHFAYPYGRYFHINRSYFDMVFKSGYVSCASAERGCHFNSQSLLSSKELLIRRDQVILDWKLNHIRFFLERNARNSKYQAYNPPF